MRAVFIKELENFAEQNPNIMVLTADLGRFFESFKEKFPKQFLNCGVAEENMIGVAAGLALSGKKVYCYSIIPFLTMRALESIRVNICSQKLDIVLLGAGGGLVYGTEGITHWAIEDIAVMRSLPNMAVAAPGDLSEVRALVKESVGFPGPLYVRFGKDNALPVHQNAPDLKIGKGIVLKKGKNIALISSGSLLFEAKKAADILSSKGINITLVSMPIIKPIDQGLIAELALNHKIIYTLEDHSLVGGLGCAVAQVCPVIKIALPDKYPDIVGRCDYLYKSYGLDAESVAKKIYESRIC